MKMKLTVVKYLKRKKNKINVGLVFLVSSVGRPIFFIVKGREKPMHQLFFFVRYSHLWRTVSSVSKYKVFFLMLSSETFRLITVRPRPPKTVNLTYRMLSMITCNLWFKESTG